jgi:hypothetical protein
MEGFESMEPTSGLEPLTCRLRIIGHPTAATAKLVATKDFNKFSPARIGVLTMLIALALGERG